MGGNKNMGGNKRSAGNWNQCDYCHCNVYSALLSNFQVLGLKYKRCMCKMNREAAVHRQ